MAAPKKDTQLFARTDQEQKDRVNAYTEAAKISEGNLVRKAVDEYIENHPVEITEE